MKPRKATQCKQHGLSLIGFIFTAGIMALVVVLGMKVVPTVVEYAAIKKAIANAAASATSARDIQTSFDRQATAGYIDSVSGKDLEITKTENGFEVSVAYEKRIELLGPTSLLINYVASTGANSAQKSVQ